jgi:soluble lytic murein transglycosylase-like protein
MRCLVPTLLLAAGLATAASATDLVMFEDGRGIRVRALDIADGVARLTLEDGGDLAVPALSIVTIERAVDPGDLLPVEEPKDPSAALGLVETLRANEAWRAAAGKYADMIAAAADRHALDRALLAAVAKVESNFNPFAVSPRGACGVLQLIPATAKRFGVKSVFDAAQNIEGGAAYLRWLLDRFEGRVDLALAGYNAGEGAVDRHHGIPPFAETQWYVLKVLDHAAKTAQPAPR